MNNMFDDLNQQDDDESKNRDQIVKAPFGWPGGKSRSVKYILPLLPYTDRYCEVFGGSGSVLLARRPSKIETFNDRYSGVTDFYKCLRSELLTKLLLARLELVQHSREEFVNAKQAWATTDDPIERAALWYTMIKLSWAGLGRNWGRNREPKCGTANKINKTLTRFWPVHRRLMNVQIDNDDFRRILTDYDHPDMVFYLDPPYLSVSAGIYTHGMTLDDHVDLLEIISGLKGFVALSGYINQLYDKQTYWDDRHTWDTFVSIKSILGTETNSKAHLMDVDGKRDQAQECLWIKYRSD